jgi:hypothetical protein
MWHRSKCVNSFEAKMAKCTGQVNGLESDRVLQYGTYIHLFIFTVEFGIGVELTADVWLGC